MVAAGYGTGMIPPSSLWIDTAGDAAPVASPLPSGTVEVAVIGAGITGLTTALELTRRGRSVVVLEADQIGCGVTGQSTVKATVAQGLKLSAVAETRGVDEARFYADQSKGAFRFIERSIHEHAIDCDFQRRAHVIYADDEYAAAALSAEGRLARQCGLEWDAVERAFFWPALEAHSYRDQLMFHPVRYLHGLAAAVRKAGGTICENTTALGLEGDSANMVVRTERGELTAATVVMATHVPFADRGLQFARIEQRRAYAVAGTLQNAGTWGHAPMTYKVSTPTRSSRTWSSPDGSLYVIAVGEGHPTGEEHAGERAWGKLSDWASKNYGAVDITHTWSTQDAFSLDETPLVGRASLRSKNLFVATGYSAWGITSGTAAGMLLAEEIAEDGPGASRTSWASMRLPSAGKVSLVKRNSAIGRRWISDHVKRPSTSSDELELGEGAIVSHDGSSVAAFRDESGALIELDARCTHLGCNVAWNPAEKTWDCRCHGSRFATTGEVLHGPATEPLKVKRRVEN